MHRGFGVIGLWSEPGKADGDTTADGFGRLPMGLAADEDEFFGGGWLEGGDVRAVEVYLCCGGSGRDLDCGQTAVRGDDVYLTGDAEPGI